MTEPTVIARNVLDASVAGHNVTGPTFGDEVGESRTLLLFVRHLG